MIANRKMTNWFLVAALLLTVLFPAGAFAAAGDVNSIEFESSAKVTMTVGQTPKQLKVMANVEGSTSKRDVTAAATWTSSNTGVVQVVNGLITPKASGTALITATYNQSVATIEVAVTYPVKNLKLEHAESGIYKLGDSGDKLQVKASVTGGQSETAVQDVTDDAEWSSSDSSVLTVSKGKLTLVSEGTATVTAKYNGLTANFKAQVQLPYSALEMKRAGAVIEELELLAGDQPLAIQAFTKESASAGQDITSSAEWSTSDSNVVEVTKGEIKVNAPGKAVITAKYLGLTKSVTVYVRSPYEALILSPSGDRMMFINETLSVKAEVRDGVNTSANVSSSAVWTSSNPMSVTVSAGAEAGVVTAKVAGTSTIKADYRGVSKDVKITVYPTLTQLTTDLKEQSLYLGENASLPKVNGTKLDESKQDISQEIEWNSDNEDIMRVKDGKIEAIAPGTATLTGKLKGADISGAAASIRSQSVSVKITVKEKVLLLMGPEENLKLVTGEEQPLPSITAVMESGEEKDVTGEIEWKLTGSTAVIKGKSLKGLVKGSATLKGTYSNGTITIPVAVEQKIVKIVIEPAKLAMNLKQSKPLKATGYYSNGKTVNLGTQINWKSSDENVATVKGTSVKAVGTGTATMTGSYQGINVSSTVTVTAKLTKLTVEENKLKLAPGQSQTLKAMALYDTGATTVVTGVTTWTSSKPSVAKVLPDGTVIAVSKGSASIKGKFGGKTVSVSVSVK